MIKAFGQKEFLDHKKGASIVFKKRRGIKISYNRQGLICFVCLDYKNQSVYVQDKIEKLCRQVGKEHFDALFEMLTTDASVDNICMKYHIGSSTTLYRLRKDFYEKW